MNKIEIKCPNGPPHHDTEIRLNGEPVAGVSSITFQIAGTREPARVVMEFEAAVHIAAAVGSLQMQRRPGIHRAAFAAEAGKQPPETSANAAAPPPACPVCPTRPPGHMEPCPACGNRDELAEAKQNYENSCKTIAAMYEAATGRRGSAARRGVVEDLADVRHELDKLRRFYSEIVTATGDDRILERLERLDKAHTAACDMIETAWGIIANVSGGDWTKQSVEWHTAASAWRGRYTGPPPPAAPFPPPGPPTAAIPAPPFPDGYVVMHSATEARLVNEIDTMPGINGFPRHRIYKGHRVWIDDRYPADAPPRLCKGQPPSFPADRDRVPLFDFAE
jgi:hypothetical protein